MPSPQSITINGKTYRSLRAAADALGVNVATVYRRLRDGRSLDAALVPANGVGARPNAITVVIDRKTYASLSQACAAFNISKSLVQQRMLLGWPIKEALTVPPGGQRKRQRKRAPVAAKAVEVLGKQYPSIRQAAIELGIPPSLVYQRLRIGWTLERALTTPAP